MACLIPEEEGQVSWATSLLGAGGDREGKEEDVGRRKEQSVSRKHM